MRTRLSSLVLAAALIYVGNTTQIVAQVERTIVRSQTNRTIDAIQNQIYQAIRSRPPDSSRKDPAPLPGRFDASQGSVTDQQ